MGPFRRFVCRLKKVQDGEVVRFRIVRTDRRRSKRFNFVVSDMSESVFKFLRGLVVDGVVAFVCFRSSSNSLGEKYCEGFLYFDKHKDLSVVFDLFFTRFSDCGSVVTFADGPVKQYVELYLHSGSTEIYGEGGTYAFGPYPLTQGQRTDLYPPEPVY